MAVESAADTLPVQAITSGPPIELAEDGVKTHSVEEYNSAKKGLRFNVGGDTATPKLIRYRAYASSCSRVLSRFCIDSHLGRLQVIYMPPLIP